MQRQHPVEHRSAGQRPDHVVISSGTERAAAVFRIILLEHHGDMRVRGALVGAQPTAQLQPGQIGQHPVDKGPHRPLDQPPGSLRSEPVESEATVIMNEILKALARSPVTKILTTSMCCMPRFPTGVPQPCDVFVTGFQMCVTIGRLTDHTHLVDGGTAFRGVEPPSPALPRKEGKSHASVRPPSTTSVWPVM